MNRLLWAEGLLALTCSCGEVRAPIAPPPPQPPLPSPPLPSPPPRAASARFDKLILTYSRRRGLDPRLVKAIISVESQFYPRAISPAGARGLMQVMPETAADVGVPAGRLREAEENIAAGTAYLRRLFNAARASFGIRPGKALPLWLERRVIAAYHGGPRNLHRDRWAPSTREYVRDVLRQARGQTFSRQEKDFRNS